MTVDLRDLSGNLAAALTNAPVVNLTGQPPPPPGPPVPPQCPVNPRPNWRLVVADGSSATITFLDRLTTNKALTFVLNAAAQAEGDVDADSPEANLLDGAGDPLVSYGNRLVYGFRREFDPCPTPWTCRFAGVLETLEDEAASERPISHFTAYDPWELLNHRPLLNPDGTIPVDGLSFVQVPANQIALDLLTRTHTQNGTARIDYGQTGLYDPGFVDTAPFNFHFDPGTSVGEAWTHLCDGGLLDIVLRPIYDPANRPGYLCELEMHAKAGVDRPAAVFGWDRPLRTVTKVSRLHDGTAIANKVEVYDSRGIKAPLEVDAASVSKYGERWLQQSISSQLSKATSTAIAKAQLKLRKNGKTTVQISPAPERSPSPFLDYDLGDSVPVVASTALREALTGSQRVYGIPLKIDENGTETVDGLLLVDPNAV